MVTDSFDPAGIYFGTRSGKLYASRDAGKSWKQVLDGLPQIVCLASAVVAELAGPSAPRPTEKRKSASRPKSALSPKGSGKGEGKSNVTKRKSTRTTARKRGRR
jgi:hypothetical protein